jgi:hypothetical protein
MRPARRLLAGFALIAVGIASWTGASAGSAGTGNSLPLIVSGTLVTSKRLPLAGKRVDLYASRLVGSATTDRKGRFVVRAAGRSGGWLKLDLLTGDTSLAVHRVVRRKFAGGRWIGPSRAGRTDVGVLILAPGQPSVTTTAAHWGSADAEGWIYGVVVRKPGSDPRSGSGSDATVPVAGDTVVARGAAGSGSAVSARDGSFQMRLPAGAVTLSEDVCGVSRQLTVERDAATRVTLEIANAC